MAANRKLKRDLGFYLERRRDDTPARTRVAVASPRRRAETARIGIQACPEAVSRSDHRAGRSHRWNSPTDRPLCAGQASCHRPRPLILYGVVHRLSPELADSLSPTTTMPADRRRNREAGSAQRGAWECPHAIYLEFSRTVSKILSSNIAGKYPGVRLFWRMMDKQPARLRRG